MAVNVGRENRLPIVATLGDVVWGARNDKSRESGHNV